MNSMDDPEFWLDLYDSVRNNPLTVDTKVNTTSRHSFTFTYDGCMQLEIFSSSLTPPFDKIPHPTQSAPSYTSLAFHVSDYFWTTVIFQGIFGPLRETGGKPEHSMLKLLKNKPDEYDTIISAILLQVK